MSEVPLYKHARHPCTPTEPLSEQDLKRVAASKTILVLMALQGYLAHKKLLPPYYHHRSLGIGLLKGPGRVRFLMSEVPLYSVRAPT